MTKYFDSDVNLPLTEPDGTASFAVGISARSSSSSRFDAAFFQASTSIILEKNPDLPAAYPPFTDAGVERLLPSARPLHVARVRHSSSFLRAFFPQGLLLLGGTGVVSAIGIFGVVAWKLVRMAQDYWVQA